MPVRFAVTIGDMTKIISTNEAPGAIGPYSQAVRSGNFLFCSGQIPLDPKSGQIVSGDITAQTRRVLDNIAAVLRADGLTFDNVVKTTIFLTDLGDFQTVNEIYGSYFKQRSPGPLHCPGLRAAQGSEDRDRCYCRCRGGRANGVMTRLGRIRL